MSNGKCLNSILASPVSRNSFLSSGKTFLWKLAQWLQVNDSKAIIVIFASLFPTVILLIEDKHFYEN